MLEKKQTRNQGKGNDMKILDGRKLAAKKTLELKQRILAMDVKPRMTIIQVGEEPASNKYVQFKLNKAWDLGIDAQAIKIEETIKGQHLEEIILSELKETDGMIVQLPLPEHINKQEILDLIPYNKDIDGLATGNNIVTPATPRGIISLLKENGIKLDGVKAGVVGQSNLVGKPVSILLETEGAIVTRFDLATGIKGTEEMDVLVVAAGVRGLIKKENIKNNVAIIDVGINTFNNGKITGDVDRESVGEIPSAISPVPGGVGPMTVISLIENLLDVSK